MEGAQSLHRKNQILLQNTEVTVLFWVQNHVTERKASPWFLRQHKELILMARHFKP